MTEDYKKNLLDYATGNIQEGTPTTDEIIKEMIEVDRTEWKSGTILPNGWADFHYEGVIQEKNSDILILYGGYRASSSTGINNEVYGIITLLDQNFHPIKSIYEYDNGTKLRYIQIMKQNDDNTFYMVDDTNFAFKYDDTILNSTKRLVLLNNFTSKIEGDYSLLLRSSYVFPNDYNLFKCENIEKNPNQAFYVMVGKIYDDAGNTYNSVAQISLNIPYRESVEWNKINIISRINTVTERTTGQYIASLINFQNEDYQVKVFCRYHHFTYSGGQLVTEEHYVRYYVKNYNSSSYLFSNIITGEDAKSSLQNDLEYQAIFINDNICYFVLDNINNTLLSERDLYIRLWEYNISDSTINKIYEKSYGYGFPDKQEQIFLYNNSGKLYIEHIIKKTSTTADYYIQRYNDIWEPILISEDKPYQWNQRGFYVSNSYNLLKLFLFPVNPRSATWYFPVIKEIYNQNQYNGEPYINKDALCPLYSNLYSNGSLVFSRNLYNISKQNNMTMSSVEIPNTYLNDTTITENDLISKTNLELVSDPTQWTKNIYEVVDINFLNTISVIDEDTNTTYLDSAIKLNNATVDGGDINYQNTPCNKFRINYTDSTTEIHELQWNTIDDTHKDLIISFYVDKAINSIDLISNDETTIYLNIPVEVEIGNYYSIKQKIRIGE